MPAEKALGVNVSPPFFVHLLNLHKNIHSLKFAFVLLPLVVYLYSHILYSVFDNRLLLLMFRPNSQNFYE